MTACWSVVDEVGRGGDDASEWIFLAIVTNLGAEWQIDDDLIGPLEDGAYPIEVTATDVAGNVATDVLA